MAYGDGKGNWEALLSDAAFEKVLEGFRDPELGPSGQVVLYVIVFLVWASGVYIRCF